MSLSISIVVTETSATGHLERCLAGIARASTPGRPVEVVVAEASGRVLRVPFFSSCTTETIEMVASSNEFVTRDAAWRRTSGEVVAFISSRGVPDDHWVESLRRGFESAPSVSGLGGSIQPLSVRNRYCRAASDYGFIGHQVEDDCLCLSATNSAYRRTALMAANGFRENAMDDSAGFGLSRRLHSAGATLRILPGALIYTDYPGTLREYIELAADGQAMNPTELPRAFLSGALTTGMNAYRLARNAQSRPSPLSALTLAGLYMLRSGVKLQQRRVFHG